MIETLISPAYQDEQRRLHALPTPYGERGHKWSTKVNALIWLHDCQSVLDYGCGEGTLRASLSLAGRCQDIREYDPAIPGKDGLPDRADLVICSDVLEHIEPDKVDAVLDHLTSLPIKLLFLVVSSVDTAHRLSDGRQAHILLQSRAWWLERFSERGWVVVESVATKKPEKDWAAVLQPC